MEKTCKQLLMEKPAIDNMSYKIKQVNKHAQTKAIPHLGGNGPPCPSSWEHLSLGWEEMA